MAISLPSHRNCTTRIRTESKKENITPASLHKTNFCSSHRNLILVSKLKWRLEKIYRNLYPFALGTFFLPTVFMPSAGLQSGRTRGLQTQRLFSMIQDFWQSSEVVGLSKASNMLRQLAGQIWAHSPCSTIRNTHLRLFRPDQGPHTRGTQREYYSKPLKHSIVKRILVFKR